MLDQETPTIQDPPTPNTQHPTPGAARRVAMNALNPFGAQVVTKVMMLGYGIAQFRLISSGALDGYILAALVFSYTSTFSDWGLTTLLARDVAKGRGSEGETEQAANLFRQTLTLRLIISLALFVPVSLFVALYVAFFGLRTDGAWAVIILTLSLLPSAFSGSVTTLLYAYERMSLPAFIGVATSAANVALGLGALFMGWGVVGLALSAFVTTVITSLLFGRVLRRNFPALSVRLGLGGLRLDGKVARALLSAGWPLMLNALLVGLFFRLDQFVIKAGAGEGDVARYEAAYRFLNFVLLITPAVTLALFPRMARNAVMDRPRLAYEYTFALKVLLLLAAPIVGLTVWFAPLLITVVTGGKEGYLPESAAALQILIFFLPFSFINGVTQYVLIALDRQRLITKAFAVTVLFNLGANLLLVPLIGIYGAALTTILSELVLLGPFLLWTGREIGHVPVLALGLKPLLAGVAAGLVGWALWPLMSHWRDSWDDLALYVGAGLLLFALYAALTTLSRPFTRPELDGLRRALRKG